MKKFPARDGNVEFLLDEKSQTACLTLYPSMGNGKPLTEELIMATLSANQIFYGIDRTAITKAVTRCETNHETVRDFVAAQGKLPVPEEKEYFQFRKSLLKPSPVDITGATIDYRLVSPFIIVNEGDILADRIPLKTGLNGRALNGDPIPFETREQTHLEPGKNTSIVPEGITALCSGRLMVEGQTFWVSEVLSIKGDIDYHTGNISYPGDVELSGIIKEGFTLFAGGSINLLSTVNATKILCKGNLASAGGLIGYGEGNVLVGGEVKVRFVQNCHLESIKSIHVLKSITNSTLYCHDNVFLGKNGIIVNSQIITLGDINVFQVGTDGSQSTVIHCGIDFLAQRKVEKYKTSLLRVDELLKRIDGLETQTGNNALASQKTELEREMQELMLKVTEALNSLDINDSAQVVVAGTVYPGTIIKICSLVYTVQEKMSHTAFSIDKKLGRIQVRNLR